MGSTRLFKRETITPAAPAKAEPMKKLPYRIISTLIQDYLNVGSYTIDWSPSSEISSGLYIVRLESVSNNLSVSEKIMFVK